MYELLWRLPPTLYLAIQQTFRSGNRVLSLFSIIGITLSVALAVGLEMSSRAVQAELDRTEQALRGTADLRISAGKGGVPESLLDTVRSVPGVASVSPITVERVWLDDGFRIQIVGVDLFAEERVHDYSLSDGGVEVEDPLRLVSGSDSILITAALQRRLGIELGDSFPAGSRVGPIRLTVRGILAEGGVADAFGGEVAAMDVFMLQALVGRLGYLDLLDIDVESGRSIGEVQQRLQAAIEGIARVERVEDLSWVSNISAALRRGILVIAVIGIIAAALVSYTTAAMSVDRRLRELALLQLAGLRPGGVQRIILMEAVVIGCIAIGVGMPVAEYTARAFLDFFVVVSFMVGATRADEVAPAYSSILVALLVGLGTSLLAASGPAWRARTTRPLDVFSRSRRASPALRSGLWISGALLALMLAWMPSPAPPLVRVVGVMTMSLLLVGALTSRYLPVAVRHSRRGLDRLFPRIGDLIGASLMARPGRTASTVAAIAALIATALVGNITIESITGTVDRWAAARTGDGALIVAGDPLQIARQNISPEAFEVIRSTPGISGVSAAKSTGIRFRGVDVVLVGSDLPVIAKHSGLTLAAGSEEAFLAEVERGSVGVTDVFARQFDVDVGDAIELDTPLGQRTFRVGGIIRDYSVVSVIFMSRPQFEALWSLRGFRVVSVWPSGDLEPLVEEIRRRTAATQELAFRYGDRARTYGTDLFRSFSGLFYAMGAFAAFVGSVGIANLLLASLLERRNELSLLRVAGLSRHQITAVVMADGLALATLATLAGCSLSMLWLEPTMSAIEGMFHWSVNWHVRPEHLLAALIITGATATVAGLYPALRAGTNLDLLPPQPD